MALQVGTSIIQENEVTINAKGFAKEVARVYTSLMRSMHLWWYNKKDLEI